MPQPELLSGRPQDFFVDGAPAVAAVVEATDVVVAAAVATAAAAAAVTAAVADAAVVEAAAANGCLEAGPSATHRRPPVHSVGPLQRNVLAFLEPEPALLVRRHTKTLAVRL